MNTRLAPFLLAFLTFSCSPPARIDRIPQTIDALFQSYVGPNTPGACVSVIQDGEVVYRKSYGFANLEDGIPVTTATNFRLASVTKQFTAMAIMILADRGELSLNDRLTDVLPGTPLYAQEVKIRHLLNHTSGIVDYESLIPDSQTVQVLDKDVLGLLRGIDSTYSPANTAFRYSNSGYVLLALVVEAVSKQPFAEFLRSNIFIPLEMHHTIAYQKGKSEIVNRAYGYTRTDSGFVRSDQSVTSATLGDGGIYSSGDDLFKWDQALYSEKLVRTSILEQAFTSGFLSSGSKTGYGFGWNISYQRDQPAYFHSGSTQGFRNAILRIPQQRLTIIILTNRNEGDPIETARAIADFILQDGTGSSLARPAN